MRITKVSASVGLTINTGNYNSGHIKLSAEADVFDGEDPAAAHLTLTSMLKERVKARVKAQASSVVAMSREAGRGG